MATHLIVGAGNVGTPLARRLIERGDTVRVATRTGTPVAGATSRSLDAKDAAALTEAATGAETLFICSNPPYPEWKAEWPPIFTAMIEAARTTGAKIVLMGSLYGYGAGSGVMTEDLPLVSTELKGRIRTAGWQRLLDAQARGELRATEVRASDYFGLAAGANAHLGARFFTPLLAGKTAWSVGDVSQPHSWAYLPDIVSTLVAAADSEQSGRAWLAPHASSASRVEIAHDLATGFGARGHVRRYPWPVWKALALTMPFLRELDHIMYQFTAPFLVDSSVTERELGVSATPWRTALTETVASYRS